MKANAGTIHEQSAIDFFTKLLEEKDQLVSHLKTQNDVLLVIFCEKNFLLIFLKSKEKQYQIEIEHLKETLQQSNLQFESILVS